MLPITDYNWISHGTPIFLSFPGALLLPWELENAMVEWVAHYDHELYHKSLNNVTPADMLGGRRNDILGRRSIIKSRKLTQMKGQIL